MSRPPVVLTIAGHDPSGGAGVTADLRTLEAVGVAGHSVVTALTVQNSHGVRSVHPTPPELLRAQLKAILSDTRPDAIKIGMLGGAEQVETVTDVLAQFGPVPPIVLDPVLASTGGVPLLNDAGRAALLRDLLPLCALLTPNQDEWRVLGEPRIVPVLLKGGHLIGPPTDTLLLPSGAAHTFPGERVNTPHTHGTGCFLSAAVAGLLAHGFPLASSIARAKDLLTDALHTPVVVGRGRGFPCTTEYMSHAQMLNQVRGVYVVTDAKGSPERSHEAILRAALDGGASVVQLRDKHLPTDKLVTLARRMTQLAHKRGSLLLVNDRADVALAAGADGVHIGPGDISPRDARRMLGWGKLVGVSAGTTAEALDAAPYASYFGVGAIYGTSTKADAGDAVGVSRLAEVRIAVPNVPLVAIGGVNLSNIGDVARAGANAAAVVSAVSQAPDMAEAVRELARAFTAPTPFLPRSDGAQEA